MTDLPTPDPDFADTEKDLVAWYKRYAQPWFEGDPSAETSASYYAAPNYFCLPDGVLLFSRVETLTSFLTEFIADMRSKGWIRTTLLDIEVRVINANAAFLEAEMVHETVDGSPVEGDGTTTYSYLAGKTPEGWRFLSAHMS